MPKKHRSLMDSAYAEIKRRIITLELQPGQRLDDYQLSRDLSISRTPVREAIFLLGAEGLVDIRSKAGFVVRALDLLDIAHLFDAMARKAAEIAKHIENRDYLAITAANADLHRLEAAATHNDIIRKMADSVHDQGQRLAYLCFGGGDQEPPDLTRHFDAVMDHHAGMVDALRRRDAKAAERIAVDHVVLFKTRVQRYLDSEAIAGFRLTDRDLRGVAFKGLPPGEDPSGGDPQ
jgi:DNA-binding GntR family transcriptional regulator